MRGWGVAPEHPHMTAGSLCRRLGDGDRGGLESGSDLSGWL